MCLCSLWSGFERPATRRAELAVDTPRVFSPTEESHCTRFVLVGKMFFFCTCSWPGYWPLSEWRGPFSNRPVLVKRFQTYPPLRCRYHSRARASLRNRHRGPSSMGFEEEVEQSFDRTCPRARTVQGTRRTHLIHRPARDIIPPLGGTRMFSYRL
jgi:hypothetical protein